MTQTLVRKLLRDMATFFLLVWLLLMAFETVWVRAAQRITTQLVPVFYGLANAQKLGPRWIEKQLFRGPAQVAQTIIGGEGLRFERAMDVLSVGFVHPVVQILLCIWAVGRATGAIAGELDRGTMELLLAQPVPRGRVIIAHLLVDLMLIPLMSMSLWAGVAAGYEMTGPFTLNPDDLKQLPFAIRDIDPDWLAVHVRPFGAACINVAALLFAMSGLSMALSAHGRFRGRVNGQAAGLFIGMFAVNVIGQIWESASFLRPFTLFYYFQPQQVILRGNWWVSLSPIGLGIEVPLVLVLGLAGAAGYFEAWRCFTRRDLPAPL